MLPLFKKSHIHSRHIEDLLKTGHIRDYATENNKRNALRQASFLYRIVDGELFRHGTDREYKKYGLRLVVHDDQPEKKAEIIAKCHLDDMGNHLGMNNTIRNVCDTYYWQGISAHVKMYLKQCEQCKNRSKFNAEEWLELERKNIDKKKAQAQVANEAQLEIKNLGRVKKPTPPETFFIVNAERKVDFDSEQEDGCMMIDSNNIEYVVETLGQSDGLDLEEVCHVLNVPDIVPIPERFRSREIEAFLKDGSFPDDFTSNMKCGLRGPAAQYRLIDGELYHEGNKAGSKGMRLVIHDDLPALKVKVMVECHIDEDGSHHGLNKTLSKIGEKYHWVGMSVDVRKFMMHCKICSEQRGRKVQFDDKEYELEAQEVKSRHMKKMNEASGSDMDLTAVPVSYDSTDIEPAEGLEQEGHQVIRLIGPNKEVTEITVAVVNQETVTADGIGANQIMQESENDSAFQVVTERGKSLVTKEMTDAVAQIEAAEAAMEIAAMKKQEDIKTEVIEQNNDDNEQDTDENTEEVLIMKDEGDEDIEPEDVDSKENKTNSTEKLEETVKMEPEGEMAQMETEDGIVNVFIIKEGEKKQVEKEAETSDMQDQNMESVESESVVVLPTEEDQALEEIARQNESEVNTLHGSYSYYKDIIFVPELKKTRMIENFLKLGAGAEGFSHAKLIELSENFEVVDDVLYRRPSRYKGRQVVIHDDMPELKLKLISEMHLKRNGQHCSELITFQNVSFKYYWEEMKWDIHRWYPTCKICVSEGGIERKSNKRLLTVAEQKQRLEQKRKENRLSGANTLKSRDFKNRLKHIDKFVVFERDENGKYSQVVEFGNPDIRKLAGTPNKVMVKGNGSNEESDVEIHIPESSDEGRPRVVKVRKKAELPVLYDLVVYATVEQERCIEEMYEKRHWNYKPSSFTKVSSEDDDDDDNDGYYLLSMKVTAFQENAIKDLFQSMGLAIEAAEEPKPVSIPYPVHLSRSTNKGEPVPNKLTEVAQTQEEVNKKGEGLFKTKDAALKTRESAAQTQEPAVQEEVIFLRKEKIEKEKQKTSEQDILKQVKESVTVKETVVQIPIKVRSAVQKTVSGLDVKRSTVTVPVVRSVMKRSIEKVESPAPPVTVAATPKRKIASVDTTDSPVSETRRSRREIKKPRRFSPDSSPQRSEPVSQEAKEKIENFLVLPEKESFKNNKRVTSTTKTPNESLKSVNVRSTKSAQTFSKAAFEKDGTETEFSEVEVNKSRIIQDDKQKAKVSVMSKGRIRVKKIPKESNSVSKSKADLKSLESNEEMTKMSSFVTKDKNVVQETGTFEEDEEIEDDDFSERDDDDEDFEEDDDEEDDDMEEDDDDDDDDMDDDMDVTEDAEDKKVPLHIILDDTLDSMEAIEVENGYVCSLCKAKFRNKNMCNQHGQKKQCYKECELCGKMYKKKDLDMFKDHVELHKKGDKFPCKDCKKVFHKEEYLIIHARSHNNKVMAKCGRCREDFYTWFQYAAHMVHKHSECNMFTCDVCNAKFANISFMKSEVRFDGKLSYFKCIMCS